jgi:IclR family acetate operon transcriptional repressor
MLTRIANQHLKKLAGQINETAHLAIRAGKHALFIEHAPASNVIAVAGQIGELLPLHCTAHGKALLADAGEHELKALFGAEHLPGYTNSTMTSIDELCKDCALTKKRQFAIDEAEYTDELRCIASPIRIDNDAIIGSIGVSAPLSRFGKERFHASAEYVCKAAQDIGILLSNADQSLENEGSEAGIG